MQDDKNTLVATVLVRLYVQVSLHRDFADFFFLLFSTNTVPGLLRLHAKFDFLRFLLNHSADTITPLNTVNIVRILRGRV